MSKHRRLHKMLDEAGVAAFVKGGVHPRIAALIAERNRMAEEIDLAHAVLDAHEKSPFRINRHHLSVRVATLARDIELLARIVNRYIKVVDLGKVADDLDEDTQAVRAAALKLSGQECKP